jgi:hypothetical protein
LNTAITSCMCESSDVSSRLQEFDLALTHAAEGRQEKNFPLSLPHAQSVGSVPERSPETIVQIARAERRDMDYNVRLMDKSTAIASQFKTQAQDFSAQFETLGRKLGTDFFEATAPVVEEMQNKAFLIEELEDLIPPIRLQSEAMQRHLAEVIRTVTMSGEVSEISANQFDVVTHAARILTQARREFVKQGLPLVQDMQKLSTLYQAHLGQRIEELSARLLNIPS